MLGVGAVAAELKTAAARLSARLGQRPGRPTAANPDAAAHPAAAHGAGPSRRGGQPSRARSFDPRRIADLEYRAWVGYYLRNWPQVLTASVGLVRVGFGMEWHRTLYGAWLVVRASQLWAPFPDNDPKGARASMARFFALVRLSCGDPANPAEAARLEVDWWRVHREAQYSATSGGTDEALVASLTRLYSYLYSEPESEVRPAAVQRTQAMKLSDQWVREGCPPDSPLLPLEHAALVRCYAALLAAVHHR